MTAIRALLIISLLLNVFLGICAIYKENQHKKELEAQKPVLNLKKFEGIYHNAVRDFGEQNSKIIAQICVRTARRLGANMCLETELLQKTGEAEVASKKCTTDIADGSREYGRYIHNLEAERDGHERRATEMKEIYELIH